VPLFEKIATKIPEITLDTRINFNDIGVNANKKRYEEASCYVYSCYFDIFDFPLAKGNNDMPFAKRNFFIISKEIAKKLFGNATKIGQAIRVNFNRNYIVSGVLEKYPNNGFVSAEILPPLPKSPVFRNCRLSGAFVLVELCQIE